MKLKILLCAALSVMLPYGHLLAEQRSPAEIPWKGERLVFELSWFNIKAGRSVMEADEVREDGRALYHFSTITNSNEYIDMFHKVRDRADSYVLTETLSSYRFKLHQEEGRLRRNKEILFDYEKQTATYTRNGKTTVHDIPSSVQDAFSAIYYLRTKELKVGETVFIDVFDTRKLWQLEVQVLGKERIETPAGTFDTVMIRPLLKFEGIFQRKGDIYIWLTDDRRKLPVRMRSKILIGSISADLVEYKVN